MTYRLFRAVTPQMNTGTISTGFQPVTDVYTGAIDNIMSLADIIDELPYLLWYFLWINRWDNPNIPIRNKGNLPEIEMPSDPGNKYRFYFSTLIKAVVATIAQLYSLIGQRQIAEHFCNSYGLAFVHWDDDRDNLAPYFSSTVGGFSDVVILFPELPEGVGVIADNETSDRRPASTANNIVRRVWQIINTEGKREVGHWMNRIGSGGALNSGLTDISYIVQHCNYFFCIAYDEDTPDMDGSEVIQDLTEQRAAVNADHKFVANVELEQNTIEDFEQINAYLDAEQDIRHISIWRNFADTTNPTTQAELDALLDGLTLVVVNDPSNPEPTKEISLYVDGVKQLTVPYENEFRVEAT